MNNLVQTKDKNAFTTTLIIAKGVKLEHRAVVQLLDTHKEQEIFKHLEWFKKREKRQGKPTRCAELTELQATFLITLMRNSPIVIKFKAALSKDFFKMRRALDKIATQQDNKQWIEARNAGKIDRRLETDVIKVFVDYATAQGSKSAERYYTNISTMENKALFFVEQKYKNLRDVLGMTELLVVQQADMIVSKALKDGMDNKMYYKDVFLLAKERIEMFAEIRGKSPLAYLGE